MTSTLNMICLPFALTMFENFGFLRNNYSYCEKFAVNRKVAFFTTTDRALRFFSGFFFSRLGGSFNSQNHIFFYIYALSVNIALSTAF